MHNFFLAFDCVLSNRPLSKALSPPFAEFVSENRNGLFSLNFRSINEVTILILSDLRGGKRVILELARHIIFYEINPLF